jgi:hypothetical protein
LETNKLNTIASANKDKSHNKAVAFNKPPSSKRPIFELSNLTEINNSINLKKCKGFNTKLDQNIFLYFPYQILAFAPQDFVNEDSTFHSLRCAKNNYICSGINDANEDCLNLTDVSSQFKSLFQSYDSQPHIKTNHKYYNFSQLKTRIDTIIDEKNDLKLENLNLRRQVISNKNRVSLYKDFTRTKLKYRNNNK